MRKNAGNNPNLDLVNINVYTKFGFYQFVLKIWSGNKIMTDGMTDNPNPIKPPLFQSNAINRVSMRYLLNQRMDFDQTCIDILLGWRAELIRYS